MFESHQGNIFEKGTYRRGRFSALRVRNETLVVNFCCPMCASYIKLAGPEAVHSIAEDGTVSPSVVCDCGFHEYVKLVDWKKEGKQ